METDGAIAQQDGTGHGNLLADQGPQAVQNAAQERLL